jgi:hypothetical protein
MLRVQKDANAAGARGQCHKAKLPRNGKRMPFIAEKLRFNCKLIQNLWAVGLKLILTP